MFVLHTIAAVQMCSVQSVCVLFFALAWVCPKLFLFSASTSSLLFFPYRGFSSDEGRILRR